MSFAKRVFLFAGISGLLIVPAMFFVRAEFERQFPPAGTHPEFYYGFAGVTTAWQLAFLILASDPVRYRPLMWAAIAEKLAWVATVLTLFAFGQLASGMLVFGGIDLFLGVLFVIALVKTPRYAASNGTIPIATPSRVGR
jgi:hypothetical protein